MRSNICVGLIILTMLMGCVYPVYGQDEGLVAHWKLDETSGNQVGDSVGGYNGWLFGHPDDSQWTEGIIDGALEFDGFDDFVWMENYKGISGGHSRTVAAWVKTADSGNIISWGRQETPKAWSLMVSFLTSGNRGALSLAVMGGIIIGETDLRDNKWHHVAAVLEDDGAPDVTEVKLYVDGRLEDFSFSAAGAIDTSDDVNVQLGAWTVAIGANKYFKGLMDDVRIYDRALSVDEIQALQIKYDGGTGEPNDPYQIRTPEQMQAIGATPEDWDKCFKLMADIDLGEYTGTQFNIIGNGTTAFTGVFDGSSHTISNFTYKATNEDYIGLFGYVDGAPAEIRNLGLIEPNVISKDVSGRNIGSLVGAGVQAGFITCYAQDCKVSGQYALSGGLIGNLNGGTITNSYSNGVVSSERCAGGLIGSQVNSTISGCHSNGIVAGSDEVGGLVGSSHGGVITGCYAVSEVSGDDYIGGLVGYEYEGAISESYSLGSVSGDSAIGGLVGKLRFDQWHSSPATVTSCYSGSIVSAADYAGGLIGINYQCEISNCYATGNVSSPTHAGGFGGRTDRGRISYCYSVGHVSSSGISGGFIGSLSGALPRTGVTHCFWDVETSSQTHNYHGGTGLPTSDMQKAITFTDAGWDFDDTWKICDGTNYPKLSWQTTPPGDFVCPDGVEMIDLWFLTQHWLDGNCGESNDCDRVDMNGNGVVNFDDFSVFANVWRRGSGQAGPK